MFAGSGGFSSVAAMRMCDPMLAVLAAEFQTNTRAASQVASASAMAYGVLQLFYGPLADLCWKSPRGSWRSRVCFLAAMFAACAPTLE